MAMTKKEREAFAALLHRADLLGALRWTEPVAPDIAPPKELPTIVNGYLPVGVLGSSPHVEEACTNAVHHGYAHNKTSVQQPRSLYSTRLLALKALRHQVEQDCAKRLLNVDQKIAALTATKGGQ